ncbi:hypothetical protein OHJ16_10205 [Actinomyces israelii]|uniref:RAMA domain-containing protein n=1 Tax=Actinomyces israelii TaxID=1659 RepID=A0ABT4I9J1_9ACTO|nr:hypothetical protein [Actinomyces israelii]MCZ0858413.1 hypothetical protein [Actinomyces israelii]WKR22790.1 hypothetical protein AIF0345_2744 [Actinomyces israelii]
MALFELTGTRLEATALGEPVEAAQRQTVLGAVRGQLVDVLRRPVFPIVWEREGDADVLTALDAASQVMCVELLERLDAAALVAAMARTAAAAQSGWTDLAARYPGGSTSFREDWDEFRETVPINAGPSPRLTMIAMAVNDDVRTALAMLLCSGIEVQEAQVRTASDGRVLVGLEPVRHDVLGGSGAVLVARASRMALERPKENEAATTAPTMPVPSMRRGTRTSRAAKKDRPPMAPGGRVEAATGHVEAARVRAAGARGERSRAARARAVGPAAAVATTLIEPMEPVEAVEAVTGPNDVTVPTVRLVESASPATSPGGVDRNHRAAAPVLGAQPTVPSGGQSAAALASVASRIDTPVTLVWQRMRRGIHHEAVLSADGVITLSNGMRFRDPSAAANAAQHTQDIDGWRVWRVGAQGPALRDFIKD